MIRGSSLFWTTLYIKSGIKISVQKFSLEHTFLQDVQKQISRNFPVASSAEKEANAL